MNEELFSPAASQASTCPHLGLREDPNAVALIPTAIHRCYARNRPFAPDLEHQETFCLRAGHGACPHFRPVTSESALKAEPSRPRWMKRVGRLLSPTRLAAAVVSVLLVVLAVQAYHLMALTGATFTTPLVEEVPTSVPTVSLLPTPTPTPPRASPTAAPAQANTAVSFDRFVTPTPVPGGEIFAISPQPGDAGWWSTQGERPNHLGDSFLYVGQYGGQSYIAGVRFDLSRVPRGAAIVDAQLRLTGLRADRFSPDVPGTWLVQLIAEADVPELPTSTFLQFYAAPASITLFPQLTQADLAEGRSNVWNLDGNIRAWLTQQLLDGATTLTLRIISSIPAGESLFAWDSGLGPESGREAPLLLLNVGPPPTATPPLPTRPVVVATLTPAPGNALTAVAAAQTATAEASLFGTPTPIPYQIVTPTPTPANLATVQAIAYQLNLPPVLVDTPQPANAATATEIAAYATAVALTTGTFTPVPTNYVTPFIYYPSPPAENVATAAARVIMATAAAQRGDPTATPLPYNAVPAIYIYATETPANQETAVAQIQQRNADAITTGTPTPTPFNLVVITRVPPPTPTPIPLTVGLDALTPTPTATPTRVVTAADLAQFSGKILFLSDRAGGGEPTTWVMDPATGSVLAMVTDRQLHRLAQELILPYSPDGRQKAIVEADNRGELQIKVLSLEYGTKQQLTNYQSVYFDVLTYDPAWSPRGDLIAFVSNNSGGDEIYTVDPQGQNIVRLTFNDWEWDKHPTWSPDGSQIAFYSNRETQRKQIWIMDADGSNVRNLSNSPYNDWDPVWVR